MEFKEGSELGQKHAFHMCVGSKSWMLSIQEDSEASPRIKRKIWELKTKTVQEIVGHGERELLWILVTCLSI